MLNPEEIESIKLRRVVFGGYSPERTRESLRQIAAELRRVLEERGMLEEEAARVRADLLRRAKRDELERTVFKSAQDTAREIREAARQDAELILKKAYKHARKVRATAEKEGASRVAEFHSLEEKNRVMRTELRRQLTSVLEALGEPVGEARPQKRPPVTQDLEREVHDLVVRIQKKPGTAVESSPSEDIAQTAEEPAGTAGNEGASSSGERVA